MGWGEYCESVGDGMLNGLLNEGGGRCILGMREVAKVG